MTWPQLALPASPLGHLPCSTPYRDIPGPPQAPFAPGALPPAQPSSPISTSLVLPGAGPRNPAEPKGAGHREEGGDCTELRPRR